MSTHTADHAGPETQPVTRVKIIDHLGSAFTGASVAKTQLLAQAKGCGARAEVLNVLAHLPERSYNRPRTSGPNCRGTY